MSAIEFISKICGSLARSVDLSTLPLGQGHPPTGNRRGKPWGLAPQGNGDGTRPKGLGHPAEGQGVNCPPLSPSRLWSTSGEGLPPPNPNFDGFPWSNSELPEPMAEASSNFGQYFTVYTCTVTSLALNLK